MPRNIFRALAEVLPDPPLQVATVQVVAEGRVTLELPGGGVLIARGVATEGQSVFVRDGLIESEAPALPIVMLEV